MKNTQRREKGALLLKFLEGSKRYFALSIIASALASLIDMINPQIIRVAVDALTGVAGEYPAVAERILSRVGGLSFIAKNIYIPALGILITALFQIIMQYSTRVFSSKASETLVKSMRDKLFCHIGKLPFSWHMKNSTGDIIQRCTSDIETTRSFLSDQLTSVFKTVLLIVLSVSFMVPMNLRLTLIAFIPTPFILLYSFYFHKKVHAGFKKCDENEGKLSAMAQENLSGVRVIRAFALERQEKAKFERHNEYYTGLWVNMAKVMSRFWSVSDILSGIQVMLVIIFGAYFTADGAISPGGYVAFISYNSLLVWPIRQLGRLISDLSRAGVSIDRIFEIMSSPEEKEPENALTPDMNADICFSHVSFSYDSKEVLTDVSFEMKKGTTLGILGTTGAGKSTLVMLFDKLYPLPEGSGRITVGGVDIKDISTPYLRKNIGLVLQEPFLFSQTIKENIAAESGATLEEVRSSARDAALDDTVMSFRKGYDTFVGEGGVTLSGGQKQRTAIARMLLKNQPVMIFDDSLSAVDLKTDALIRRAINVRSKNSSVIIISHRINTLSSADKIIVLEHGKVAAEGTHSELIKKEGLYKKIYEAQSLKGAENDEE